MLRPTVIRPVHLGLKPHLGPKNRFLLLSDSFGFVDVGGPLWREDGSVVYNCLWSSPEQSFPGSSPAGLLNIFSVSDSRLPQLEGLGPRIYFPQEHGGPVITPGTGFPFRRFLRFAGLRWLECESESYVTTDGQPASLSWNKAPMWGLRSDLYYLCDSYGLVLVGRPLWREVGSVFCMCCWPLPAQSFSGPSPLGFETIFYCLRFETSLFVASYISQGHGGGIRPRLNTGLDYWLCMLKNVRTLGLIIWDIWYILSQFYNNFKHELVQVYVTKQSNGINASVCHNNSTVNKRICDSAE
jgi:hypothetical protein